ncbi:MAG TPA: HRDC domain-containing protein [Anaerovoracaceae bacterium]|nr:HRDC domain-containing protein [Anaerovoracaceae bacterium]
MAELFLSYHTPNTTDYTKKYRVDKVEETITIENNTEVKIEDTPIYQELKQFRHNRSKEENVKPYFIYNNTQMEQLINFMPKSFDGIKSISGVGDVKCLKYGDEILKIIEKYR